MWGSVQSKTVGKPAGSIEGLLCMSIITKSPALPQKHLGSYVDLFQAPIHTVALWNGIPHTEVKWNPRYVTVSLWFTLLPWLKNMIPLGSISNFTILVSSRAISGQGELQPMIFSVYYFRGIHFGKLERCEEKTREPPQAFAQELGSMSARGWQMHYQVSLQLDCHSFLSKYCDFLSRWVFCTCGKGSVSQEICTLFKLWGLHIEIWVDHWW